MWDSPFFLESHARERTKELSQALDRCRLAQQLQERSPAPWRRFLARRLAAMSLRLDDRTARAALQARLSLR